MSIWGHLYACMAICINNHIWPYSYVSPEQTIATRGQATGSQSRRYVNNCTLLFDFSDHADGERRAPLSIRRCLKRRLIETFRMPPSDST